LASLLDLIRADIKSEIPARGYEINELNEISRPPEARLAGAVRLVPEAYTPLACEKRQSGDEARPLGDEEWICRVIEEDQRLKSGSLVLWSPSYGSEAPKAKKTNRPAESTKPLWAD
jgi:hypothetical protein